MIKSFIVFIKKNFIILSTLVFIYFINWFHNFLYINFSHFTIEISYYAVIFICISIFYLHKLLSFFKRILELLITKIIFHKK